MRTQFRVCTWPRVVLSSYQWQCVKDIFKFILNRHLNQSLLQTVLFILINHHNLTCWGLEDCLLDEHDVKRKPIPSGHLIVSEQQYHLIVLN